MVSGRGSCDCPVATLDGFPGSPGNPAPGGALQEATTVNVQTRITKSAITLLFSNQIVTWLVSSQGAKEAAGAKTGF